MPRLAATFNLSQLHPRRIVLGGWPAALWKVAPWVVAVAAALWALRGVGAGGVVLTDAARHALNGAFIHDWVQRGSWIDPIGYAARYYAFWPALSIPYHPPLFPAFEAIFYLAFGVSGFSARLAVAVATALSVLLLWRLARATHGSLPVAFASVVVFASLPMAQQCSRDVMLEFPALVPVLGALLLIPREESRWTWRRALAFAVVASAAVWTKQQTLFVALVPLTYALLAGRWAWWSSPACWLATAAPVAAYLALEVLAQAAGGEALKRVASFSMLAETLAANFVAYGRALRSSLGVALAAFAVGVVGYCLPGPGTRRAALRADALFWAWMVAGLLIILPGRWLANRYLFFVLPPFVVIGAAGVLRLSSRVLPPKAAAAGLMVAAIAGAATQWGRPPAVLHGPTAVARRLAPEAGRVLYCGYTDGQFVFALRSAAGRPNAGHTVIRCDKLPRRVLSRDGLVPFAREYGVGHIVLERSDRPQKWDELSTSVPPGLVLVDEVALEGVLSGSLRVYRFDTPSSHPKDALVIRSWKVGSEGTRIDIDWSQRP